MAIIFQSNKILKKSSLKENNRDFEVFCYISFKII
jgi:hypothetical protein